MRRFDFLEIVLAILTLMVVLAIMVTILALAYPDVTSSIIADIRQSASQGQSPVFVAISEIAKRASDGFNYRVKPLVRNAVRWAGKFRLPRMPVDKTVPSFAAKDCAGCHEKLFTQRAWRNIYVDHRLHEAEEIVCNRCHTDIKHPRPKSVSQAVCIDCHKDVKASTDCKTCHPPGSILAGGVIPAKETKEFLAGRTASLKAVIRPEFAAPNRDWLKTDAEIDDEHQSDVPCANCHDVPDFCNACHLVFHDKEPNWKNVHGARIFRKEYLPNGCWICHNPSWCANTCHAGVGRQRRRSFLPAPKVPLEDYIQ